MRLLLATALLCVPQLGLTWGGTGHRIVCEIAYQELTTSTRNEVDRLIALDSTFNTFADSCNYPDRPRKRGIEHYVNVPRDTDRISRKECVMADRCTFTAIDADLKVLKKTSSSDADKLESIKFLGHWVGDLHQPLHVSFQDDKGGNDVEESAGPCSGVLHGVWDSCIIQRKILNERETGQQVVQLAETWRTTITDNDRDKWTRNRVSTWANESFQITIAPETDYCDQVGNKCIYDAATGRETFAGGTKTKAIVNNAYIDGTVPIIKQRLIRAGVRLANILNNSL